METQDELLKWLDRQFGVLKDSWQCFVEIRQAYEQNRISQAECEHLTATLYDRTDPVKSIDEFNTLIAQKSRNIDTVRRFLSKKDASEKCLKSKK